MNFRILYALHVINPQNPAALTSRRFGDHLDRGALPLRTWAVDQILYKIGFTIKQKKIHYMRVLLSRLLLQSVKRRARRSIGGVTLG